MIQELESKNSFNLSGTKARNHNVKLFGSRVHRDGQNLGGDGGRLQRVQLQVM